MEIIVVHHEINRKALNQTLKTMPDHDKQNLLLLAVEHLKHQYHSAHPPCIALLISRHYRLLANATLDNNQQQHYDRQADLWLIRYISHSGYPPKIQQALNDLLRFREFSPLHP